MSRAVTNNEELVNKQVKLERLMIDNGEQRFTKRSNALKSTSLKNEPHKLITKALPAVAAELTKVFEAEEAKFNCGGTKGRVFDFYKDVVGVDIDTLAYIGLNMCFDSILKFASQTTTMTSIGRRVELENWALGLKDYDPHMAKRIEAKVTKDHTSQRYRIKAARIIANKGGYKPEKWDAPRCTKVGSCILNAVLKASDLFMVFDADPNPVSVVKSKGEVVRNKDGKAQVKRKTKWCIGLTDEAREELKTLEIDASWAEPMYGPMIVPPKPWTSFDTGCYYDPALAGSVSLVRGACKEQKDAIDRHFVNYVEPGYVKALNAIQATPLKINKGVLDALSWVQSEIKDGRAIPKGSLDDFPIIVDPQLPIVPENLMEMDADIIEEIFAERKEHHLKLREADASRENLRVVIKTATEMNEYEQFYLPWNFCWRSRMYPVSTFNYHRDDHVKALFLMANGKKVTAENRGWVMVAVANTGAFDGIDKKCLEDRMQWVDDNHLMIMEVAKDYKGTFDHWSAADKPFQYLAACQAYADMIDQGDDWVAYLPVGMDATNSGTQIYSALSLDTEDGRKTNLIPMPDCQDVYSDVAKQTVSVLNQRRKEGCMTAGLWLDFGVGRKQVKTNTMTYGYSSVVAGFTDQLVTQIMIPMRRSVAKHNIANPGELMKHHFGTRRQQTTNARYLAEINYNSVQNVTKSVAVGMEFLQGMTDAVSSEGKSVRWQTPSGFPVVMSYTKWTKKKTKVYLWDRKVKALVRKQVTTREPNPYQIDKRKMRAAVAANYVHSLDASLMQSTVLLCLDNDITDYFMIHDSFATTVQDTWTMYHCIRHSFVATFKDKCLYAEFEKHIRQRLANPEQKLPAIPKKGNLDLNGVLESEYCFS